MTSAEMRVLAVFGPSGSGKTAVAEELADVLGTGVVSADAMQVYRELPVLTNQPVRPTRLVGIRSASEEMSVGEYAPLAHRAIDELVAAHGGAVIAGGTGLYLRAALAELQVPPAPAPGARERWEREYDADPDAAYALLGEIDPAAAARVHRNDRRRVVRALELAHAGGSLAPPADRLWTGAFRHPTLVAGLELPAPELRRRIEQRTEAMFTRGVVGEVRAVLSGPGPVSRTASRALGLREVAELPPGEARARIVERTMRYASYQRKWMRRIPNLVVVDASLSVAEQARAILLAAGR
jgi:tRNA dimethylallyltransferase